MPEMTESSLAGSLQFNNITISNEVLCKPWLPSYRGIGLAIFPLSQIIANGFVLFATFRSRRNLRHNYVYAYVMNALMVNLVFAMVNIYNLLNRTFVFERNWSSTESFRNHIFGLWLEAVLFCCWFIYICSVKQGAKLLLAMSLLLVLCEFRNLAEQKITGVYCGLQDTIEGALEEKIVDLNNTQQISQQKWWAFRSSFVVGLYLLINASVSALIYGIRGSSYLVGRYLEDPSKVRDSIAKRRNKAIVIISTIWIAAIGISLAGAFVTDSCLKNCICVFGDYDVGFDYCQTPSHKHCSRVWRPSTKVYLLAVALIWCLEIMFVVLMLSSALRKSRRIFKPKIQNSSTQLDVNTTSSINQDGSRYTLENSVTSSDFVSTSGIVTNRPKKKVFSGCGMSNQTIQLLFVLSLIFFLTTCPLMIAIFVDVINEKHIVSQTVSTATILITMLYGILLPIIMVYYMPRLRQAVENLFLSIKCCTKTVPERKRPRAT